MLIGHLAPVGPIAATVERRWRPEWPRWTRRLPWAAALAGCVLPDLDVVVNMLFNGVLHHLGYFPHSIFTYLPVLFAGILLVCWRRTRLVGWTALAFGLGVLSHLLLDVVSHGTVLFYPLWNGLVGWTFPRLDERILVSYLHSPNFWLEPLVILAAAIWWLRRYIFVWKKVRFACKGEVVMSRLSALPRHEGSRMIPWSRSGRTRLDKLR
ncbi:MAG: metal-dependent hydrolase [Anaerolineae bacterium]|nr:metal-dependent hydrolase [Anaerolineae bacterium]